MKKYVLIGVSALALAACEISEDPADGGFLSGVVGIAGGGYQARIDALEAQLATDQARANALASEQLQLQAASASNAAIIRNLKAQLAAQQAVVRTRVQTLEAQGVALSPAVRARVQNVTAATATGRTDAEKLASLRAAIANARALSDDLSRLS